jgi:hypothetical protein
MQVLEPVESTEQDRSSLQIEAVFEGIISRKFVSLPPCQELSDCLKQEERIQTHIQTLLAFALCSHSHFVPRLADNTAQYGGALFLSGAHLTTFLVGPGSQGSHNFFDNNVAVRFPEPLKPAFPC